MDSNTQKLLSAVSAALGNAGYANIAIKDETVTATKDAGGAYFRVVEQAKGRVPLRTSAGGPEPLTGALDAPVTPGVAELQQYLSQNPDLAPAFGISAEALKLMK